MTLEIVLPTYNHPSNIEKALKFIPQFKEHDFLLSIYDSSMNEETKKVVEPYLGEKVRYSRIDSKVHVDEKTVMALKEARGDFVLLCGDKYFPNLEEIFRDIDFEHTETELFIIYENSWKNHCKVFESMKGREFADKDEFFEKHFWQATLYGGSICRRSIFERMNVQDTIERFNGSGFIYPSLLAIYSEGPYDAFCGDFLIPLKTENTSGWIENKQFAEIWIRRYPQAVQKLKGVLKKETIESIIHTTGYRTNFLTARGLAIFRLSDNYNYAIYRKYKKEMKECRACSAFTAWVIAFLPKWVFQMIRATKRALKPKAKKENQ